MSKKLRLFYIICAFVSLDKSNSAFYKCRLESTKLHTTPPPSVHQESGANLITDEKS